jgi:hypothetical protein
VAFGGRGAHVMPVEGTVSGSPREGLLYRLHPVLTRSAARVAARERRCTLTHDATRGDRHGGAGGLQG